MRPVLVSAADLFGGAARAAHRIHASLRDAGHDAHLLVRRRQSDESSIHEIGVLNPIRTGIEVRLAALQRAPDASWRSSNVLPSRVGSVAAKLAADVVNLHWIGDGTISVREIGSLPGPVVMTLHDMWAFSGAEHYPQDDSDARWRTGYLNTTRGTARRGPDIDRWTWERKRRRWRPVPVICPSRWLADCVRASALMRDWPVHVVPNPVPGVFAPDSRAASRHAMAIQPHQRVILFGAASTADARKGQDLLLEALGRVKAHNVRLIVLGSPGSQRPRWPVTTDEVGFVGDDDKLSRLYNVADVVVVPSRQDNLPLVGVEAQACGVPVVAFDTGGLPDVVEHLKTGYLARAFDTADLAHGIDWVLEDDERRRRLADSAADRARRLWSPDLVARRYLSVYQQAIDASAHSECVPGGHRIVRWPSARRRSS